jgi:hypothetical protein
MINCRKNEGRSWIHFPPLLHVLFSPQLTEANEKTTTQLALGDNHEDGKSRETSCLHMQQKLHFLEAHPISKKRFMTQGPDLIFTAST